MCGTVCPIMLCMLNLLINIKQDGINSVATRKYDDCHDYSRNGKLKCN